MTSISKPKTSTGSSSENWRDWPPAKKLRLLEQLQGRRTRTPPGTPHTRQAEFLAIDCEEALYGGAGGGGKTWALLKWLGEGAKVPTYSGLFLRRTYPQLTRSNDSPVAQSHEIYPRLGGRYTENDHKWVFPSGAVIEFGHMQYENSIYEYQGPSYHRVAFDELTQFSEGQYTYLFSRVRKPPRFLIKPGIRAAANPGGEGHLWVKKRFVTQEAMDAIAQLDVHDPTPSGMVFYAVPGRAFCPARIADNPALDIDDYITRLMANLSPVLAAQIAAGDWRASEGSLIQASQFRYYSMSGDIVQFLSAKTGERSGSVAEALSLRRFATIDTAGTSDDVAKERRGRSPSWSTMHVWDYYAPADALILRHVWRRRVGWADLKTQVQETIDAWCPQRKVKIENAHFGPALLVEVKNCQPELVGPRLESMVSTGNKAKLDRAVAAGLFLRLQSGGLWLPDVGLVPGASAWISDYEAELLAWTGLESETADQVDGTSYACAEVKKSGTTWGGVIGGGRKQEYARR